jgi:hypothetical protein
VCASRDFRLLSSSVFVLAHKQKKAFAMAEVSVKAIVDGLNAPPLSRNFTLVSFDQLPAADLVGLLNDVFYLLDAKAVPKDLKEETPEYTAYRMADFLRVLQYRHLMDSYV